MHLSGDRFAEAIAAADWRPKSDAHRDRMRHAFRFICNHFNPGYLSRPAQPARFGPSALALSINGSTPLWLAWMQAINFDCDVYDVALKAGTGLANFREPGDAAGGNWYCTPGSDSGGLAVKPTQTQVRRYTTVGPTQALVSVAGDMLVDWGMNPRRRDKPQVGRDYWYRSGGQTQYLIPNARERLKSM